MPAKQTHSRKQKEAPASNLPHATREPSLGSLHSVVRYAVTHQQRATQSGSSAAQCSCLRALNLLREELMSQAWVRTWIPIARCHPVLLEPWAVKQNPGVRGPRTKLEAGHAALPGALPFRRIFLWMPRAPSFART